MLWSCSPDTEELNLAIANSVFHRLIYFGKFIMYLGLIEKTSGQNRGILYQTLPSGYVPTKLILTNFGTTHILWGYLIVHFSRVVCSTTWRRGRGAAKSSEELNIMQISLLLLTEKFLRELAYRKQFCLVDFFSVVLPKEAFTYKLWSLFSKYFIYCRSILDISRKRFVIIYSGFTEAISRHFQYE